MGSLAQKVELARAPIQIFGMKSEEVVIHCAIRRIQANRPPPPQIHRYRMLNEMIAQYKLEYRRNIKILDEYRNAIQFACQQF